ncbi:MAG: UDP-N-acetylglucosamine--N-acetylmuramyl-(pentapeptide) pyrophosphoryl-undecaprenol N-acetylglucosamine transferase [Patescibacteria group bacterium]|nr:UDP-N-acetylglucosamine--N-acetylmuramyl-(pentapeptide) pyrophosphoryl-undecaprenol N-acetylglucosamine transferase [Patescibacteria group bacterium]
MKVLFTGGFTLGPVTPLLAVSEEIRRRDPLADVFWIGTMSGPERELIAEYNIPFKAIVTAKFRRYFSLYNLVDFFYFFVGLMQSFIYLLGNRPDVIVSAGGFVSVPVVFAGWALGIPSLIHQQDVRPGLANRLMAPFAKVITVSFEKSLKDFSSNKSKWIGNPVREDVLRGNRRESLEYFNFTNEKPVLLVLGGGTGAARINELVKETLSELLKFCQVLHIAGPRKGNISEDKSGYRVYPLLTEGMSRAYDAADLVVSRAGMGTLTELAALAKPAIIIPMPDSHQEKNVEIFESANAAQYLPQETLTPERFVETIRHSFEHLDELREKAKRKSIILPRGARDKMADLIIGLALKK